MRRSGISLIVLVITIVVIIILTSAIVLNISSNNPINKANEAVFKTNVKSIQEELSLYISSNIQPNGTYTYPLKSQITSASKYNSDVLNFAKEKVVYKTSDINEKTQLESMGVIVDYTDGLVANYKMNGATVIDSVSGSVANNYGATQADDRYGKSNSSYTFNGTSNYIEVPYIATLAPTVQVTCSGWAYRADWSSAAGYKRIFSKTESGGYAIGLDESASGYCYFLLYKNGTGYIIPQALYTGLSSGWHYFAGTFDGRYAKLYIDGVVKNTVDSSTINTIGYSNLNSMMIGAESGGGAITAGGFFTGKIDDVRVYNKALTDSEIKNLYDIYWAD